MNGTYALRRPLGRSFIEERTLPSDLATIEQRLFAFDCIDDGQDSDRIGGVPPVGNGRERLCSLKLSLPSQVSEKSLQQSWEISPVAPLGRGYSAARRY